MVLDFETLPLPRPVADRLDQAVMSLLGDAAARYDFAAPSGEPALVAANSVSWRIFKNHVTLFIGGVTAVLLELAEPRVRDGVWQHSSFRTDALTRLQRTGLAAMVTVYGARSRAEAMIAGVIRRHAQVTGTTTEGEVYEANDPALLDWVQATATFGFMQAYHIYAQALPEEEQDAVLAEARPAARLYGAVGAPRHRRELRELFELMSGRLMPSAIVLEFLEIMKAVPALPGPARPLQTMLIKAAVDILPSWVRTRLRLGPEWSLSRLERAAVVVAARAADKLMLPSLPHIQACRRLGLPDNHLYRR